MIIHRLFGYPEAIIKECVEAFVAFGLIEINRYHAEHTPLDDACAFTSYSYGITITGKGRFFLTFPFVFPDWLFFLSLDAPVHAYFSNSTNYFRVHRDIQSADFLHHFYDAYVVSVPNFLKHFVQYSKTEVEEFDHVMGDFGYLQDVFPSTKLLKERFSLPSWAIERSVDALTKAASDRGKHSSTGFSDLEATILGWQR